MKIKTQVYLISFFSCLFPLFIISSVSYYSMEKEVKKLEKEKVESVFYGAESYLERIVKELRVHMEVLEKIQLDEGNEKLTEHMTDFSSRSKETIYFAYGDESGKMYMENWVDEVLPEDYDPRIRPWYKGAMDSSNGFFTSDIFIHAVTEEPVMTLSMAMGGDVQGVIMVLLNLNELKEILGAFEIGESGRFFILDDHGHIVLDAGSNEKHLTEESVKFLLENKGEQVSLEFNGKTFYYFINPLKESKLIMVGGVPEIELLKPLIRLRNLTLIMIIASLLITSLFIVVFATKLIKSIERLAYIIDNIARGNYTKNIQKLTHLIDEKNELFLVKEGVRRMQSEIKKREEKLKLISETDSLTRVYNRGAIMRVLNMEVERAKNFETEFILIMFDLDRFKKLNDTFGHQFGDKVLQEVSSAVSGTIKLKDSLGRYGGEEFLILLPDTNLKGGIATAERVRHIVEELKWEEDVKVTISIGVECFRKSYDDKTIISVVDGLLYRAKKNGRNRVESN